MKGARGGFWPLRDLPVVVWLAGVVVVAVLHGSVPAPRWLLIHLLFLGAATHSIVVWSRHFTEALLHTPAGDRRVQSARLLLLNAGVALVLAGVVSAHEPVVIAGAAAVAVAVLWHGSAIVAAIRRALPGRFRSAVRYYVAAAAFLPVGATLGTLLAHGLPGTMQDRTVLAHATLNVLGWIGLPVVGTLVTLWPTMLRTRIAEGAERAARRALPVLVAAIVVAAGGALLGWRPVAALGLALYVVGLGLVAPAFVLTARNKPPTSFPTWSVAAGIVWLVGCLVTTAVLVGTAPTWAAAGSRLDATAPLLAVGFGAQVLLGALSYLIPTALGGGALPVRAATAVFERAGALRLSVVNAGLLVCTLPVPGAVHTACAWLVLAGFAAFLPLLFLAIPAARRARTAPA